MKRGSLSVFIAVVVAAGMTPAHALSSSSLAGVGSVTLVPQCPGGFKIPLKGEPRTAGVWSFTIAGLHAGCVVTWGNPITFVGAWDPARSACDPRTGLSCPTSTDVSRPGFLALGAVPQRNVLVQTTLRFCIKGSCWEGTALVERP